ncbi:MAG: DNA polymerase III subunit beta [Pseudomonadota bacterium]
MKLAIERSALLRGLGHVQSVVERRNTIPILSNILLEADGNQLRLTATDLELSMVETLQASVSQPGATTLQAVTFYEIVRKLPDGAQIELASEDATSMAISAGRSNFKLACLPREDFPVMTDGEMPHQFSMGAETLKRLIDTTRFAMSTEETRHYLNGIYVHIAEEEGQRVLRAVSTDGHRLAKVDMATPPGAEEIPSVIIPRKAVGEIAKMADTGEETIQIGLSEAKIRVSAGAATLTSKLIDASYPDYQRVIPKGNDRLLTVGRDEILAGVERVATLASDKTRAVKFHLDGNMLELLVSNPEAGSAKEELEVEFGGDPLEVGFNSRYLTDILSQVGGDSIEIRFADANAPTLMRDPTDDGVLFVLMPMRV